MGKVKSHFRLKNFFTEYCVLYELMWQNMVHPEMAQMLINTTHVPCILDDHGNR